MSELPVILFESQAAWTAWLETHGASAPGLWMKIAKKGAAQGSISYAEALDIALCFGWIDGQKDKFDDQYWLQKFTARRPRSIWSKVNCDKAEALIAAGRMRPAGLAEVERAKADGRWDAAYESQSRMVMPDDFQAALDANPTAAAFFATLNSANRYAIYHRIITAKKPETRQRRIDGFIAMLAANEKLY